MTKDTLTVTGMTCEHCEMAVAKAIKKFPGITNVVVDRKSNSAQIEWDESQAKREQFVDAVNNLGYQAK